MKKTMTFLCAFLLPLALLLSQSLVEVSKKEQERRAKLKGKNVKVVTNDDLKAVKRTPAVTVPSTPPAEGELAEPPGQEYPDAQAVERASDEQAGSPFATGVLADTLMVENPEFALHPPDGRYAEISIMGFLELDVAVRNGPGDDIAVYARWAGGGEESPGGGEEGIPLAPWPGGLSSYGVLVWGEGGEWEAVGRGTGEDRPETFDLGENRRVTKIRIIYKPDNNASAPYNTYQLGMKQMTMGIDAVEALH